MNIDFRDKKVDFQIPVVMGIINVTPDSFSDGGKNLDHDSAMKSVEKMVNFGADIIDIGGESSRPGADIVKEDDEISRVIPLIKRVKKEFDIRISIDTSKERVARFAVEEAGADMVNDISALRFSKNMAETVAKLSVPIILMHMKGSPKNMQEKPFYTNVIEELSEFFKERIKFSNSKGIKNEKIIIDPGIGFGKRVEDNIEILDNLRRFTEFGMPVLIGLSRKSFLGKISGESDPEFREIETVTANIVSILNGASILRVHNVENCLKSVKVLKELTVER